MSITYNNPIVNHQTGLKRLDIPLYWQALKSHPDARRAALSGLICLLACCLSLGLLSPVMLIPGMMGGLLVTKTTEQNGGGYFAFPLACESASERAHLGINYGLSRPPLQSGVPASPKARLKEFLEAAKELLKEYPVSRSDLHQGAKELLPEFNRLQKCFAVKADPLDKVWGQYAAAADKARLTNFCYCHNPFVCPNCGPKVAERKRVVVQRDLSVWYAEGHTAAAVVLTIQHFGNQSLAFVDKLIVKAFRKMLDSKPGRKFKAKWRLVGWVISPDYTYGDNGHHPHRNLILFLERSLFTREEAEGFTHELKTLWVQYCEAVGGFADYEHGCKVSFDKVFDFVDYLTSKAAGCGYEGTDNRKKKGNSQWGAAEELTKHEFKSRREGLIPTDLVAVYLLAEAGAAILSDIEPAEAAKFKELANWAAAIFQEYAAVFKGQGRPGEPGCNGKHFLDTQPRKPNFRKRLNELSLKHVEIILGLRTEKPTYEDVFRLGDDGLKQLVTMHLQGLALLTLKETKGDPVKMREFFTEGGIDDVYFPALDPEPDDIAAVRRLNAFAAEWNS